jgi:uncharacterized protein YcbK (DUF882 family)
MREKIRAFFAPETPARRRFLGFGLASLALPLASRLPLFGAAPTLPPDRGLSFYNTHTGESESAEYCLNGCLVPGSLARIDRILRDTRTDEVLAIDVGLLDLLNTLARTLPAAAPFHVISGYRSPRTNEYLRTHGGGGVAANSLHLVGKAVDIRVPGIRLRDLYRAAVGLRRGGVGIYPASDFVHVDVGRVRTW